MCFAGLRIWLERFARLAVFRRAQDMVDALRVFDCPSRGSGMVGALGGFGCPSRGSGMVGALRDCSEYSNSKRSTHGPERIEYFVLTEQLRL